MGPLPPSRDEPLTGGGKTVHEVLVLDQALQTLSLRSPRQAPLMEACFFGGLEMREVAAALEISEATTHRDCRDAREGMRVKVAQGRAAGKTKSLPGS